MKILMVCLGNICRSPLAEGILNKMIVENHLGWEVDSAGTSGYHSGERPDSRSIEVAENHDIDIRQQKSRQFKQLDFDKFDRILVMDRQNHERVLNLARSQEDQQKVKLILEYTYPNEDKQVPDPYYEGGFEAVFDMIEQACKNLLADHLESAKN